MAYLELRGACCAAAMAIILSAPPAFAQAPLTMSRLNTAVTVRPDGTFDSDGNMEILLGSEEAARFGGQLPLPYSPSLQTMEIVKAETRKADGSLRPVALDTIQERLLPAAQGATTFDDRRVKIVVFPDLAAGDTLVAAIHSHNLRAFFPGYYINHFTLTRAFPWTQFDQTISVPPGMTLQTATDQVSLTTTEESGRKIYHFHVTGVTAQNDARPIGEGDTSPRFYMSSFKDWAEFATVYAALAQPKAAVTPPVQALANDITHGVADHREQARLLYEWVSAHIRYVNVVLGIGGFEPHDAATVITNRYGDCKDHTTLFNALLAAKGIAAEMVAINASNLYSMPAVAELGTFDHMISYLPEFDLYADTTIATAPFGTLAFSEYGKPVLHIGSAGEAVRRVKPLAPDVAKSELTTTATLNDLGVLSGYSTTTATGPFAITLRANARAYMETPSVSAEKLLKTRGSLGIGTFEHVETANLADPFTLIGSFRLDPQPELLKGDAFQPPRGLRVLAQPGDYLLGQLFDRPLKSYQSTPCWSGRQIEDLSITIPDGRHIERLPKSTTAEVEGISYTSTWSLSGNTIHVHRELVSTITASVCEPAKLTHMAPTIAAIKADLSRKISLADD